MAESFEPVTPLLVNYCCNKCEAVMVSTGQVYQTSPPKYPYICPSCGFRASLNEAYPVVRWFSPREAYLIIKEGDIPDERPAKAV